MRGVVIACDNRCRRDGGGAVVSYGNCYKFFQTPNDIIIAPDNLNLKRPSSSSCRKGGPWGHWENEQAIKDLTRGVDSLSGW